MAEPIDLDQLEAVVASGSFTSREIARQLQRRHAEVRRALKDDWRFVAVRDGRRHVWGLTIDEEVEAEPEPDTSDAVPGTVPDEPEGSLEAPAEEQPEEAPWTIEELDNAVALVVDHEEREVIARLRVLNEHGALLADELDADGKLVRIFEPLGVVDLLTERR